MSAGRDTLFLEDFRRLEGLVCIAKQHNITFRALELLLTIRTPRMPGEIEALINMDRMTLKKIWKERSDLISKVVVDENPRQRGRKPTLYGLTEKGVDLLRELNEVTEKSVSSR